MSGNWSFKCKITWDGDVNGLEIGGTTKVEIPLFADAQVDAERQAIIAANKFIDAAKREDRDFFKQYCRHIEEEDGVSVTDFRLNEKKLDVHAPRINSGCW